MDDLATKPPPPSSPTGDPDAIDELPKSEAASKPSESSLDDARTPDDAQQSLLAHRKGKRRDSRVRFEPEEKMVSCSVLPSPWDNAPATNKVEAVTAYRESCKSLKVRPVAKVVQRLQNIDDFKTRCDVLDLKNVKLDNRSCEALESVFKRLQFVTVNLDNCGLEDDGAMAVFEMLDFYDSAHRLVLSHNPRLTGRAWLSCSRMMKKTHCITFLDVRECVFDDFTIPLVGRPIRANCVLKTLHIEGNDLAGRTHLILVAALKTNFNLTELFLGSNRLAPDDMVHMGSILKMNSTLQLLDLRDNNIGDQGLSSLCEGLWEQQSGGLTTLVLWNNRITSKGMQPLSVVLPTHPSLETLNLGNNRIESTGCQTLKMGLLGNRTLKRLGLVNCRILCEGAIALAEVIGDNKPLQRVDLRENDIRLAGLLALSLAHRVSRNLVRLDLKKNIRAESRDQELIKKLLLDIEAYGQRNKIEVEEREARESVLLRQKTMEQEKTKVEEAAEQERRSDALHALSTALHAQALVADEPEVKEEMTTTTKEEEEEEEEEEKGEKSPLENGVEEAFEEEALLMEDEEEGAGLEMKVAECVGEVGSGDDEGGPADGHDDEGFETMEADEATSSGKGDGQTDGMDDGSDDDENDGQSS